MPFVRGILVRGVCASAIGLALVSIAGCSTVTNRVMHPFGGGSGPKTVSADDASAGIGVNGYLWRATLDTLSFMPLASADPTAAW